MTGLGLWSTFKSPGVQVGVKSVRPIFKLKGVDGNSNSFKLLNDLTECLVSFYDMNTVTK